METREERRSAVRYPVAVPIDVDGITATTRNVSTQAVSFRSPKRFDTGVEIDFVLHLPDRDSRLRMDCHGRVVRCEVQPDGAFVTSATIDVIRIGKLVIGAPESPGYTPRP
jgi:hypothetical protein